MPASGNEQNSPTQRIGDDVGVAWMTRGRRPDRPAVLAHRGGAALGAENTTATLTLAAAAGAHAVEVDLIETADGHLVMWHDAFVASGDQLRWVRESTLDEIAALTGERPGTHTDLLDRCAGLGLGVYAEVKSASTPALHRFVDDIARRGLQDLVCVGSFRSDIVATVSARNVVDTSWLFYDPGVDPLAVAGDLGCAFVHPCFDLFPDLIDLMQGAWMERLWAAGRGVVSWNTTDPALMVQMAAVGVAAICSDDPRVVPNAW
ncbi:MAG: glycerophosphodiester phosphodiesterase [Actinomycetes bacterium]